MQTIIGEYINQFIINMIRGIMSFKVNSKIKPFPIKIDPNNKKNILLII